MSEFKVGQVIEAFDISLIKESFNVRQTLDDARVREIASLYEAGIHVDPIHLDVETLELLEGRTRLAAKRSLDHKTVNVIFIKHMVRPDQITYAAKSNMGGKKPPVMADLVKTFVQLINEGLSFSAIAHQFEGIWSETYINNAYRSANSRIKRIKLAAAKHAVSEENITVQAAAAKYGLTVQELSRHIAGNKFGDVYDLVPHDIKNEITHANRSHGGTVFKLIDKVDEEYQKGMYPKEDFEELFKLMRRSVKSTTRSINRAYNRFLRNVEIQEGILALPAKKKKKLDRPKTRGLYKKNQK